MISFVVAYAAGIRDVGQFIFVTFVAFFPVLFALAFILPRMIGLGLEPVTDGGWTHLGDS